MAGTLARSGCCIVAVLAVSLSIPRRVESRAGSDLLLATLVARPLHRVRLCQPSRRVCLRAVVIVDLALLPLPRWACCR
jgi:hypothetical protein